MVGLLIKERKGKKWPWPDLRKHPGFSQRAR